MEIVKLSKKGLEADVKSGLKRSEIAAKYNLPLNSLQKAFKQAGLTGMRAQTTAFEFVDDEEEVPVEENISGIPETFPLEMPNSFGTPSSGSLPLSKEFE